jgi:release factor glutamine methyltransferase
VQEWEPAEALFAAGNGLAVLFALVDGARARLASGGVLALEVGVGQAQTVAARMRASGAYASVRVIPDLAGRERVVSGDVE